VFRVTAANNDDVWNQEGASLAFTAPPAFWQTTWFALLVMTCLAVLPWALARLRIRQVSAQVKAGIRTRMQECDRMTRELHDTLLHTVTELTLQVRAAANQVAHDSPLRLRLETALARANQSIVEGRDRAVAPRTLQERRSDLGASIAKACHGLAQTSNGPDCHVSVRGKALAANSLVADDVESIAREVMARTLRHARCRSMRAEFRFDADALRRLVHDDGSGLDVTLARPSRSGLAGIRERSTQAGGPLRIRSGSSGTEVARPFPAEAAYCDRRRLWPWPAIRRARATCTRLSADHCASSRSAVRD
jgi:signal transduction histidine kinase